MPLQCKKLLQGLSRSLLFYGALKGYLKEVRSISNLMEGRSNQHAVAWDIFRADFPAL